MRNFDTMNDAVQAFRDFAIDKPESCPAHISTMLRTVNGDLPQMAELLRSIYDCPVKRGGQETVGPELAQIAAGALGVFAQSQFMDIGKPDNNGMVAAAQMRLALLRDAGEPGLAGINWPDPAQDIERRPLPKPIVMPSPPTPTPAPTDDTTTSQ